MRNCRLNPDFIRAIKNFFTPIVIIISLAVLILLVLVAFSIILGFFIYHHELWNFVAYFNAFYISKEYIEPFWLACSSAFKLFWILLAFGILITFIVLFIYGLFTGVNESYTERRWYLQSKLDTEFIPMWKVWLSYIIVCDKTK